MPWWDEEMRSGWDGAKGGMRRAKSHVLQSDVGGLIRKQKCLAVNVGVSAACCRGEASLKERCKQKGFIGAHDRDKTNT